MLLTPSGLLSVLPTSTHHRRCGHTPALAPTAPAPLSRRPCTQPRLTCTRGRCAAPWHGRRSPSSSAASATSAPALRLTRRLTRRPRADTSLLVSVLPSADARQPKVRRAELAPLSPPLSVRVASRRGVRTADQRRACGSERVRPTVGSGAAELQNQSGMSARAPFHLSCPSTARVSPVLLFVSLHAGAYGHRCSCSACRPCPLLSRGVATLCPPSTPAK